MWKKLYLKVKKVKKKLKLFTSFPVSKGKILNINDLDQGIDNLNSVPPIMQGWILIAGNELGWKHSRK